MDQLRRPEDVVDLQQGVLLVADTSSDLGSRVPEGTAVTLADH